MRCSLVIASLLAVSLLPAVAAAEPTYISVNSRALPIAFEVATADHATLGMVMVAEDRDLAVLVIDGSELGRLADAMQARGDVCAGFMVYPSLLDALAAVEGPAQVVDVPPEPSVEPAPATACSCDGGIPRWKLVGMLLSAAALIGLSRRVS